MFEVFNIFAQNIDCGYPQSMIWSKNKKNSYTPANPSFSIYIVNVGFKGYRSHRDVFVMIKTAILITLVPGMTKHALVIYRFLAVIIE